jgi:hypothetical protein
MSEATPRRILHLVVEGFPPERREELVASANGSNDVTEIFQLTEASASKALEKIFAADTVAVWSKI